MEVQRSLTDEDITTSDLEDAEKTRAETDPDAVDEADENDQADETDDTDVADVDDDATEEDADQQDA